MNTEQIIQILIILHATLGGIALTSGAIAILSKKGGKTHKLSGKFFFYAMLLAALDALVISILPNHVSPFLFSIGVFSTYFLLSGYRSLTFKKQHRKLVLDKIISGTTVILGAVMIVYPLSSQGAFNIILSVFGIAAIIFGLRDLLLYRNSEKLKKDWLKMHLGKMMGAYISASTAFFVVNGIMPGIWNWFVPSIIGSSYIVFWMRKLNSSKKQNKSNALPLNNGS